MRLGLLQRAMAEVPAEMDNKSKLINTIAMLSNSRGDCSMCARMLSSSRGDCSMCARILHAEGKRKVQGMIAGKKEFL